MTRKATLLGFVALGLVGCHTDMWRQPKTEPLGYSNGLFTDGAESRPLVPGTIPLGHLREDRAFYTGIGGDGRWVATLPDGVMDAFGAKTQTPTEKMAIMLERGQDRYRAYCTPCHGQLGNGEGMIAHRGFALRRPVGNYHTDRLRNMPAGHFYDVITNGYGAMYSYASRIEPQDRWAVVAYIRALQLSQNAGPGDVDPAAVAAQKSGEGAPAVQGENR